MFEETGIAVLLGLMTLVTFGNVVLRYVFNSSLIWGLELSLTLLAWLVLFGMAAAVKVTAYLGVDAVLVMMPSRARRIVTLFAALTCLLYMFLLLKGAWDYWAPFAGFQQTGGRWFPTGFIKTRDQGWYESESMPMLEWLRFIAPIFNEGERYGKIPRFLPYFILPFGCALLLFRLVQASWGLVRSQRDSLIVSHEAEDAISDVRHLNAGD